MDYARYIAIALYFGFLLFVGRYSYNKNANMGEYLLDNRRLGPVVTALSAGASDMSGWMLLGVPGALYATGFGARYRSVLQLSIFSKAFARLYRGC